MTENKRFTLENDIEMKDNWNINKRCYHFGNGFDAKDCCNMLNELAEENTRLKEENQELLGLVQEDVKSWSDEKKQALSDMSNAILGDFE
jgi:hypothetical protein